MSEEKKRKPVTDKDLKKAIWEETRLFVREHKEVIVNRAKERIDRERREP